MSEEKNKGTLARFNDALKNSINDHYNSAISKEAEIAMEASSLLSQRSLDSKSPNNSSGNSSPSTISETFSRASDSLYSESEKSTEKGNSSLNAGNELAATSTSLLNDWSKETGMDDAKLILKLLKANARDSENKSPLPSRNEISQNPEKYAEQLAASLVPDGNSSFTSVDKGLKNNFNSLIDETLTNPKHPELATRLGSASKEDSNNLAKSAKKTFSVNVENIDKERTTQKTNSPPIDDNTKREADKIMSDIDLIDFFDGPGSLDTPSPNMPDKGGNGR
jgi:hypothetical protein